jgi:hypothetical protein
MSKRVNLEGYELEEFQRVKKEEADAIAAAEEEERLKKAAEEVEDESDDEEEPPSILAFQGTHDMTFAQFLQAG